jgi:APA family basic amino acid/polyamine antiporter
MYLLPKLTWQLLAAWTAIGMTIYFVYGMRNSTIGQQEQQGR